MLFDAELPDNLELVTEELEFPQNLPVPPYSFDCSREGLSYIAGFIAHKFYNEFPELGRKTSEIHFCERTDFPWISALSRGGLMEPSSEFFNQIEQFENLFNEFHGSGISSQVNVINKFNSFLLKRYPSTNPKVSLKFSRTRTFIRIKYLNHQIQASTNTLRKRESKKISHFTT